MSRYLKITKRIGLIGGIGVAGWALDKYFYYSTIQRNVKTLVTGVIISIDYKLNFNEHSDINALHTRVANLILDLCKNNGGLYIKFGQQIASVPVLPPQYNIFKALFDNAPCVEKKVVERIFLEEFGTLAQNIYEDFDYEAIASASIAQVHKAKLKDGTVVAVKVQKPEIQKQIYWDMICYRVVIYALEKLFDLPLYWSADYIEFHLRQETDFINEAKNAEICQHHINQTDLKKYVHVPKVYHEYSTKRVMTTEWIDGFSLAKKQELVDNNISLPFVMDTIVKVFADQIFRVGFVHCDPHPGNILVRKTNGAPQVVLLDHGLYVRCTPKFVDEYATFWKSLFSLDIDASSRIAKSWGIEDLNVIATATLARPWRAGKPIHSTKTTITDLFEAQKNSKNRLSKFLKNTESLPKELIFVGRNLNCVRANNKMLGSPVNRINIMANCAAENAGLKWQTSGNTFRGEEYGLWNHLKSGFSKLMFQTTLAMISLSFKITQIFQYLGKLISGKGSGFEDVMDSNMRRNLESMFPGMNINESAFDG
ncbi:hypothetical protein HK103_002988 [Boothiomyces macroporosus]|uniref:ABC1 atypical kinase-like domain-containing protein n=1 Tax=Boothiomyces macroporosus TaxID=261099 RepID=A0AAD5UIL9_9FUNG|nr:hypothetical protein HK103_002988 [Boothiomyces macroporosus]